MADTPNKNGRTSQDGYPLVGQFEAVNQGDFVIDIHALYKNPQSAQFTEVANNDNTLRKNSSTMDLAQKCTGIQSGDDVMIKIWVEAGNDLPSHLVFSYDSNGAKQCFQATGTTLNDSLTYVGAAPVPVKKFRLTNWGMYVADIHALYKNPGSDNYSEVSNCHNIAEGQEATMDLGQKCTGIQPGAIVKIKVWVMAGVDYTYDVEFSYSPDGPGQDFQSVGVTINASLVYIGTWS